MLALQHVWLSKVLTAHNTGGMPMKSAITVGKYTEFLCTSLHSSRFLVPTIMFHQIRREKVVFVVVVVAVVVVVVLVCFGSDCLVVLS